MPPSSQERQRLVEMCELSRPRVRVDEIELILGRLLDELGAVHHVKRHPRIGRQDAAGPPPRRSHPYRLSRDARRHPSPKEATRCQAPFRSRARGAGPRASTPRARRGARRFWARTPSRIPRSRCLVRIASSASGVRVSSWSFIGRSVQQYRPSQNPTVIPRCERAPRTSHAIGARRRSGARERV